MSDDEAVPVDKAVTLFFPHGGLKRATLMSAIRKGRLGHIRLGRAYFVTRADVEGWVQSCRRSAKELDSGSEKKRGVTPSGSSGMDDAKSALAAARAKANELKRSKPNTSSPTGSRTPANVISLKSASQTYS